MLTDGHGRVFPYLRLSLTDICNFRCSYCLPDGYRCERNDSELSSAQFVRLARAFTTLGTRKIRLTGGEPTVRRDFTEIATQLAALPSLRTLALTTNGYRLTENALIWRTAGINAINISLDSLDAARFAQITGHDRHAEILRGVDACIDAGYSRVKLNTVLMRGVNDDELDAFLGFVRERPVAIRFIELMETGDRREFFREHHVPSLHVREHLLANGWQPCVRLPDAGPAQEFAHPDYAGRIGLIAPYSRDFCTTCNRLRVSSRGEMHLCLFGDGGGIALRDLLEHDEQHDELTARIRHALAGKQAAHRLHEHVVGSTRQLAQIGGERMRHEKPGLIGLVPRQAGPSLQYENRGLPLGQEVVAGGEVTLHGDDIALVLARLRSLAPNAELRAISAVRSHAREAITLGDANWREIRCGITLVNGMEEQVIWPAPLPGKAANDASGSQKCATTHPASISDANRAAEIAQANKSTNTASAGTGSSPAPVLRVRITVSGIAARSLGSDALAGAAAALTTLATHCNSAQIGDLRIYAIDIEGRARFVHPCPLPDDISALLPAEKPALLNARCAVITLSDRASQGIYEDKSGERLAQIIAAQGGTLAHKSGLPDDEGPLSGELLMPSRRGDIDLVICTGGTGIGPRDITPETILALGMRPMPGIGELLRAHSAHIVRSAWLSRAVAGTLGQMIVIALPGSQKAVAECMEALLPLLPHTLSMLRGGGHDG